MRFQIDKKFTPIIKLEKTCYASPAQWEGKLESGHLIYIRYRYGNLSISISENVTENIFEAIEGIELLCENIGDGLDGFIEFKELKPYLEEIFDLSKLNYTGENEYFDNIFDNI